MADTTKQLLGAADKGQDPNQPGTEYTKRFASVFRRGPRFELVVVAEHGKNRKAPSRPEVLATVERRFQSLTLDELLKNGLAEIGHDPELSAEAPQLISAIREAIFQAQVLPAPLPEPDPERVSMLAKLERLLQTHEAKAIERIREELTDFGVDAGLPSEEKREAMLAGLRRILTLP